MAINAAKPVGLWAAARTSYRRAGGLIRATLVVALGMFDQQGLLGLKRAVGSSGSTVGAINAAIPVGLWAAASRACGLIRATLVTLGMFDQQVLLGL